MICDCRAHGQGRHQNHTAAEALNLGRAGSCTLKNTEGMRLGVYWPQPERPKWNIRVSLVSEGEDLEMFTLRGAFTVLAALCVFSVAGRAAGRPPVMGRNAGVSAGHPLTTAAAFEILTRGGNAFDAGVAALLVGGVVQDQPRRGSSGAGLSSQRGQGHFGGRA